MSRTWKSLSFCNLIKENIEQTIWFIAKNIKDLLRVKNGIYPTFWRYFFYIIETDIDSAIGV